MIKNIVFDFEFDGLFGQKFIPKYPFVSSLILYKDLNHEIKILLYIKWLE